MVTGMASHHSPPGIPVSLLMLAGMEKRIQGCLFGMCSPAVDILRQIDLYRAGRLRLDELITRRYPLESINNKHRFYEAAIPEEWLVIFTHDHELPWAYIDIGEKGRPIARAIRQK